MTQIPNGWASVILGEVRVDRSARVAPADTPDEIFELFSIPSFPRREAEIVRGADIGSDKQSIEPGTVLVSKINPRINRVWVARPRTQHRMIASTEWVAFAPLDEILPEYLAYYLRRDDFREYLATNVSGVGGSLMRVRPAVIDRYPFVLPPMPEQRRIVAALDEHLTDLDVAVAGLERAAARIKHYRRAILCDVASPSTAARRGWQVRELGELAATSSGGTPNRSRPQYFGGNIPWLKSGELSDGIVSAAEEFLTEEGLAGSSAKLFPPGTLCVALYGATVGRLGILDFEAATNQAVCGIRPNDDVDVRWLFYVLLEGRERLIEQGKGGAQSNISQGTVRAYPVPVPTRDEQRSLITQIEEQFAIASRTTAVIHVQLARAVRLRQSILKRALEGKLVSQDSSDEPASELLARIRDSSPRSTIPASRTRGGRTRTTLRRGID